MVHGAPGEAIRQHRAPPGGLPVARRVRQNGAGASSHPRVMARSYGTGPAGTTGPSPPWTMLTHRCLDPQDPYAEREVRVVFAWAAGSPRLIAALDEEASDILPDLIEAQCDDLRREIVAALPLPRADRTRVLLGCAER